MHIRQRSRNADRRREKGRSVFTLTLDESGELTPCVVQSSAGQLKGCFFTGHNMTSTRLQHLFYALLTYPERLAKLRAEHDTVVGNTDVAKIFVAHPGETMKKPAYTPVRINEALCLWSPAGAVCTTHTKFELHLSNGTDGYVDNCVPNICQHFIQYDAKGYDRTANGFIPKRWVGDTVTSDALEDNDGSKAGASKISISAWRPFQQRPQNCIGQERGKFRRDLCSCV